MLALVMVGIAGLAIAAVGLTQGPDIEKVAAGLGWPVSYVGAANEWAAWYRVPLEWVLATIIVESGGKPNVRGDADGRSLGLMQVNVIAHAAELAQGGRVAVAAPRSRARTSSGARSTCGSSQTR